MSDKMIPFGKHKGKPIEAILDDRPYVDWLLAQPWFKERHTNLYTIVINNGQEPTDTPEHNAIQIKFLSEEFRLKFALAVKGKSVFEFTTNEAVRRVSVEAATIRESVIAEKEREAEDDYQKSLERYPSEVAACQRCNGNGATNCWHREPSKAAITETPDILVVGAYKEIYYSMRSEDKLLICSDPQFEVNGRDVEFTLQTGFGFTPPGLDTGRYDNLARPIQSWLPSCASRYAFAVEIKPTVGDDYPSVLRQMKRNKSDYLLLRAYTGIGATEGQFKAFFKSQDITVIFERDVDALTLPKFDREISRPPAD